jgi:hypothetical protein
MKALSLFLVLTKKTFRLLWLIRNIIGEKERERERERERE